MKHVNKYVALVVTCIFIIGCVPAFARETSNSNDLSAQTSLLNDLGLMPADYEKYDMDKELKRGEFASFVVKLAGIEQISVGEGRSPFKDVDENHNYCNQILLADSYGYMTGTGDGLFNPDAKVTYHQVVKIVMSIMGYDDLASVSGGYPYGYLSLASQIGLLKDVNTSGDGTKITYGEILKLIYNMLDAQALKLVGINSKSAILSQSDTYTFLRVVHNITKCYGVLNGTRSMLSADMPMLSENEVLIDVKVYKLANENDYSHYFGYNIEYYLDSEDKVVAISDIESKSYKMDVSFDDVTDFSYEQIIYYYGDKEKKINFSTDTDFIQNGFPKAVSSFDDILKKDGNLTLIYTDSDSSPDLVCINTVDNYAVKGIDTSKEKIYDMYSSKCFDLSKLESYSFSNEFGVQMYLEEVGEYDVISIITNGDGNSARLVYSNTEIDGTIESVKVGTPSYITIDGTNYRASSGFSSEAAKLKSGDSGIFVFDIYGNIASYIPNSGKYEYGYIMAGRKSKGLEQNVTVKLLSQSGEIIETMLSDKVILDGKSCKAQDVADAVCSAQLVRYYKVAGKIKGIDTLSYGDGGSVDSLFAMYSGYNDDKTKKSSLIWNSRQKILGMKLPVSSGTTIFCVPSQYSGNEKDYVVKSYSSFVQDRSYYVNAYASEQDAHVADVLIMYDVGGKGNINKNTPFTVVDSISLALNEDGDSCYKLYGYRNGAYVENLIEDASIIDNLMSINPDLPDTVHKLGCGDVIKAFVDDYGVITEINLLYDYKANILSDNTTVGASAGKELRMLKTNAYSMKRGIIKLTQNSLTTSGIELDASEVELINGSLYTIYRYNAEKGSGKMELASLGDIVDYKTSDTGFSEIILCAQYNNPGILIVR